MDLKKIFLILFLMLAINVKAENQIYNIDIDVYIDKEANASITEYWHVKGSDGTEWYKPLRNLGNSVLSNFTVSMDGTPLKEKTWNIHETLEEKKGYYGINYTNTDTELCFGKYDFNEHLFTIKYNLSNYVFNTNESQVLYWTYFSIFQDVNFQNMSVTVHSYYEFPDTLDVWGYGYKGYAYVKDGAIHLSNEENSTMNGNYVVLLAKFPLNTFNTDNTAYFETFDDVYSAANEGSFKYDYDNNYYDDVIGVGFIILFIGGMITTIGVIIHEVFVGGYGYINNKKIIKKETLPFRDIPCKKDIYYANVLIFLNSFGYRETNIFGAIILKWIKEKRITIDVDGKVQTINFTINNDLDFKSYNEKRLYNMMYEASDHGVLDTKSFKKWTKKHYSKFLDTFNKLKNAEIGRLESEHHIYKRTNKQECKKRNVLDDTIYEDSKKLLGLKLFLQNFSSINTKETIEVHLWDEYLIFASLFGIADKVAKQLKNLYPELVNQDNFDYRYIYFINNFSTTTVQAASAARSAAESYSSGGGGFSSGGGGGGSFGGGGFSGGGSR